MSPLARPARSPPPRPHARKICRARQDRQRAPKAESRWRRRSHPGRRRPIDRAALRLGDPVPGVAIGGMQPAAAEINRTQRVVADRQRPTAEARTSFDQQAINPGVPEPPARSDAGRAAADDHHLGITACHVSICDSLPRQGTAGAERTTIDHLVGGFCRGLPPRPLLRLATSGYGRSSVNQRSWPAFYLKTSIVPAIRDERQRQDPATFGS